MPANQLSQELLRRIEVLEQTENGISADHVVDVVRDVLSEHLSVSDQAVYKELEGLAGYIQSQKTEMASIHSDEISETHIPNAADELDAITATTADATNKILEAAEKIEAVADRLSGEDAAALSEAVTQIYEASTFQDLTGQRISKVIETLRHIEGTLGCMLKTLRGEPLTEADLKFRRKDRMMAEGEEDLLNGPQLDQDAMSQDDIDAILASLE